MGLTPSQEKVWVHEVDETLFWRTELGSCQLTGGGGMVSIISAAKGVVLLTLETARVRDGRVGAVAGQADFGELKVEKVELGHGQALEEDHALFVLGGTGNEGEARGREEEGGSPHGGGWVVGWCLGEEEVVIVARRSLGGSAGCEKQEGSESGSRLRLRLADWFWIRDTRDFNEGRGRWQNTMARCRRRVVPARK